ncbi:protein-methionine-sulfoxide reductase heme-binding subunit MsrQ [Gallaecimonas mangrovi]|uniref:sulfite oxidase heme-binding subunit YedZ n=1 Tax=Gallaecimonas mangrovi TaxID=2291597 RepID=UPI000E205B0E|nr:protein-methionine-sulfoxide reductase heme-binding subunit MsrQ [Gallaecimonas mangrovi]
MLLKKPLRLSKAWVVSLKTLLHLFLLGYLAWTFYLAVIGQLTADPVQGLLNFTGIGTVNLLFATLAISPLAKWLPCGDVMRFRRMVGVYAFVYGLSHFTTYLVFELQLNFSQLSSEIAKRPYILVGFSALMLLLALSVTSPMAVRRKMGKTWQQLHNWVYLCLFLALLHYSWSQKTLWGDPLIYWAVSLLVIYSRRQKLKRGLANLGRKPSLNRKKAP